ncbi:MAG: N-Acetyl-D-glucosamine ABC transport system, permease protein 1 [Candidatus Carbobacillus altaicus]|uniref:N-Acetyl-D-glucosamine ABC transport system, permease protein 1 n=1 Tax=Candidatus Carbonibacillus altaicus TaxID=2163959 RepID=A0A2R6XXY9_9BACL|nr:MAG: N-Acetyl-D-glucosamine ABC transport system, permease protein 1 [Candidatus Carbobacillus altaicus]
MKLTPKVFSVFLLPALVYYLTMVILPIGLSFYTALFDWNGIGQATFIGLGNFKELLFNDPLFWQTVKRNLLFALFSMAEIPFAFLLAALIARFFRRGQRIVAAYFLPVILSAVVVGQLWQAIYHPLSRGGLLNQILVLLHLDSLTRAWLSDPNVAMYALYFVALWQYLGYHVLIQYTGIQNIPHTLQEAAIIDGANTWQIMRHIVFPLNIPFFKISLILAFIGSLQAFELIMVTTGGGPAEATEVMSTYMYNQSFLNLHYGYGSAIASFLVMFSLLATFVLNTVFASLEKRYDIGG